MFEFDRIAILVSAVLLSTSVHCAAQTTWIVDKLNRPGAHFTTLSGAVNSSSPGDTILIRYVDPTQLLYGGAVITHGLTIVGIGGSPGITGSLRVEALPADQHVVLRNLRLAPIYAGLLGYDCNLLIRANSGSAHLQNVHRDFVYSTSTLNQWLVEDCGLVTFTECTFFTLGATGTLRIEDTELVTMHNCSLGPGLTTSLDPTLKIERSVLVLHDTSVMGPGSPVGTGLAIAQCDAELRLTGNSLVLTNGVGLALQGGYGGPCMATDIVIKDPPSTLGPSAGVALAQAPYVPALGGHVNGSRVMSTRIRGEPGGFGLIAGGLPAVTPGPFLGGTSFLDPASAFLATIAPLGSSGSHLWSQPLPTSLAIGTTIWLQAASTGSSGLVLTPPAVLTLP